MCDQRIRDGHLVCIRDDEHTTHVYQASAGPDLDQPHHHANQEDA